MMAPTTRKISERGTTRSVSTVIRFGHPEITELFPRFNARSGGPEDGDRLTDGSAP